MISYLFLIILAILPSLIWLLFYLRKDAHPESNRMILKVFFWGMLAAVLAIFIELGFLRWSAELNIPPLFLYLLNTFIGVALVEELLKYLAVRDKVFFTSEIDEPLDIMLYFIIAALGFAALENILKFLSPETFAFSFGERLIMTSFIFISSTFLHALVSGTLGFFLALGFFETKKRALFIISGIAAATLLHGLYNFYIMTEEGILSFAVPVMIIAGLAVFISSNLRRMKKMKSVCKI